MASVAESPGPRSWRTKTFNLVFRTRFVAQGQRRRCCSASNGVLSGTATQATCVELLNQFSACRCPREKFKAFDDHAFATRQIDNLCQVAPALPAHCCHVAILEVAKKKIRTVSENCFQFLDTVLHSQKRYGTLQASGARDIVTPYLKASRACCSQDSSMSSAFLRL